MQRMDRRGLWPGPGRNVVTVLQEQHRCNSPHPAIEKRCHGGNNAWIPATSRYAAVHVVLARKCDEIEAWACMRRCGHAFARWAVHGKVRMDRDRKTICVGFDATPTHLMSHSSLLHVASTLHPSLATRGWSSIKASTTCFNFHFHSPMCDVHLVHVALWPRLPRFLTCAPPSIVSGSLRSSSGFGRTAFGSPPWNPLSTFPF